MKLFFADKFGIHIHIHAKAYEDIGISLGVALVFSIIYFFI